jgi:hypothetical protein
MDVSLPRTEGAEAAVSKVEIPQYRLLAILAVWAAAALPMAALVWLAAPALEDHLGGAGDVPMFKALIICLTAGLIWQFVLVVVLVRREQRTLRWPIVREALWLRSPRDPNSGRRGGRVWLILIPLIVLFAIEAILPTPPHADNRDFGHFLDSDAGQQFLSGAWGWYGFILVFFLFNTVLGEELPLSRAAAAADERCLRTLGLGRERPPLRRLPPARAMGDPGDAARHLHHRLPGEAVPERLDRDRRPQRAERRARDHRLNVRRLSSIGTAEADARRVRGLRAQACQRHAARRRWPRRRCCRS